MSNTELTGPFQSINLLIPEASHFLGTRSQSSSTLSQDMAVQEISSLSCFRSFFSCFCTSRRFIFVQCAGKSTAVICRGDFYMPGACHLRKTKKTTACKIFSQNGGKACRNKATDRHTRASAFSFMLLFSRPAPPKASGRVKTTGLAGGLL